MTRRDLGHSSSVDATQSKELKNHGRVGACGAGNKPQLVWSYNASFHLYAGDCRALLSQVRKCRDAGVFDMIFADPPYFLSNGGITCKGGRMVSVDKGQWDRSAGPARDHEFNKAWLRACQLSLKPNGTLWVSGTGHIIHSVGYAMQELGFKMLNDITWEKPNPPPNLSCRYFTHSTETIIWAAKSARARHTFNYDAMRRQNGGKQMKSVWQIAPPESWEKGLGKHPTQKPIRLLTRIVEASTVRGDLVLDPFMGSGTTGVACALAGRRFVGIDADPRFVDLAIRRIRASLAQQTDGLFETT